MNELISVYTPEGSDKLVGLIFQNRHGAFARQDRRWVLVGPNDTRFDGLEVSDIFPENTAEVLAAFDAGEATLADIRGMYSTEPLDVHNYEKAAQ